MRSRTSTNPVTLDQLWVDHVAQWHDLGWSREQVSLWLASMPVLKCSKLPSGELAWFLDAALGLATLSLADEMVALLRKAGRPMPLFQLVSRLQAGLVVTEPMLRSAAQQDARLELKGQLLKLVE